MTAASLRHPYGYLGSVSAVQRSPAGVVQAASWVWSKSPSQPPRQLARTGVTSSLARTRPSTDGGAAMDRLPCQTGLRPSIPLPATRNTVSGAALPVLMSHPLAKGVHPVKLGEQASQD